MVLDISKQNLWKLGQSERSWEITVFQTFVGGDIWGWEKSKDYDRQAGVYLNYKVIRWRLPLPQV